MPLSEVRIHPLKGYLCRSLELLAGSELLLRNLLPRTSVNSRQRSSPNCLPSQCHKRPGCLVSRLRVNSGIRKVMVMRVFVAGGTGVVGRPPRATQEGATK